MATVRPRGTDKAKVIEVIRTESAIGYGTQEDPVRPIYQYWDFEGNLLAQNDTIVTGEMKKKLLVDECTYDELYDIVAKKIVSTIYDKKE